MVLKLFIFCLFISTQVQSKAIDEVRYTLGSSGVYVESDRVRARVLSIDAGLKVLEKIDSDITVHAWLLGNFENGSNSAAGLKAEFQPNQAVNLMEGGLRYKPNDFFKVDVGTIWQNTHQSPLLVWGTSFAGVAEEFQFGDFKLKLQQSIPNNNILARRIGGVNEGTPYFFLETINYLKSNDHFHFNLDLSAFQFNNLYSQVALVSQDFGNTVEGIGQAARFTYGYQGYNLATQFLKHLKNDYQIGFTGQYLYNQLAPTKRNVGYLGELNIGKKEALLKIGAFRNESDSSPAFYNSRFFGHNNMQGSVITMTGEKDNVMYRLQFVSGKNIESNVRQADVSIVNFLIVRNYEI